PIIRTYSKPPSIPTKPYIKSESKHPLFENKNILIWLSDRVAAVVRKMFSSYSKKYGFIININVCFLPKGS
ncbi:hypothetical protein WAJ35_22285, partial [Acinetobacter baumannii]